MKKSLIALTVSGLLWSGAVVTAQVVAEPNGEQRILAERGSRGGERGERRGGFGANLRGLTLGSSVTISFFNGDPATGGTETTSITHVIGTDSESAFAEAISEARENATHMIVAISEQTRTFDLAAIREEGGERGGRAGMGKSFGRHMSAGGSISATFYDADPEQGGNVIATISFTEGEDSARGYAEAFRENAETAAFVVVTQSATERTIEISNDLGRGQGVFAPQNNL